MSSLDGRDQPGKPSHGKKDEEERDVKFFSENLSSLVAASTIREVHLTRQSAGPITTGHHAGFMTQWRYFMNTGIGAPTSFRSILKRSSRYLNCAL